MKRRFFLLPVLTLIFLLVASLSHSQEAADSLRLWVIDTEDGNSFMGTIAAEDSSLVVLLTETYGEVHIPLSQIKKRKQVLDQQLVEGNYWFENPHDTRYFFMSNGYGLQKGEGYYQNTWILFNQLNYGISNFFSMGAGIVPLFLFAGSPTPVFITPKLTIPVLKEKLNLGSGMLLAYVLGEEISFGIAYGAATLGNRDKNLTLGAGWAFADWDWAKAPTLSLSGMVRVSKKTYLVTENYYIGISGEDSLGIIALGGRSVQKRLAIDYGLVFPIGIGLDSFLAIPWLGIAVPFGNTR